jgi:hypothetical protein
MSVRDEREARTLFDQRYGTDQDAGGRMGFTIVEAPACRPRRAGMHLPAAPEPSRCAATTVAFARRR